MDIQRERTPAQPILGRVLPTLARAALLLGAVACGAEPQDPGGDAPDAHAVAQDSDEPIVMAGKLRGIVRDLEGRPVSGAGVVARIDSDALAAPDYWRNMQSDFLAIVAHTRSGEDGRFEMEVETGPLYSVLATYQGTKSNRARVYVERPFGLTIGAYQEPPSGDDKPERVGEGSISGRVLDAQSGAPIAGAVIRRAWRDEAFCTSDAGGRYRVAWTSKIGRARQVQEGAMQEAVFVFAAGYRVAALPTAAILEGENTTHDVRLVRGIGVRGRIVDASGKPVAGLRLVCEDDVLITEAQDQEVQYGSLTWTTRSDENGRWAFEELQGGVAGVEGSGSRYWVRGLTEDGLTIELAEGRFPAGSEESIEIGDVPIGPTSSVRGRVRRADNKAIEQAPKPGERPSQAKVHYLKLWDHEPAQGVIMRNTPWVPIDASGGYRIPKLAPGRYELAFWVSNKLETEVRTVTIGRATQEHVVDVTIGAGRSFEGSVVDENGKPVDAALLRAYTFHTDEYFPLVPEGDMTHKGRFLQGNVRVLTKPDGTYLLTRIRSRVPIQLVVTKSGYETRKIRVEADSPPPERIVLTRKGG